MSESERAEIERFQRDVIEPSMTQLVLIDFWAEWCGPCKQLSPLLDKIAGDYADKGVRLVKLDVDAEKFIAAQFRIQSIPTVYAMYQGQPVGDLSAFRTEPQFTKAIDQLLAQFKVPSEGAAAEADIVPLLAMGEDVLAGGDAARAAAIFSQIREMAPGDAAAIGGLARALLASGDMDAARAALDEAPAALAEAPDIARARAALELASAPAADTAALDARIAADPDDHGARLELAGARAAAGDRDGAADALLEIIGRERDWNGGAARQRFLQLLEAQGLADPWASAQRRRLSAVLFT